MLGPQRRRRIVEMVHRHGVLRISEIVDEFGVSRKTALRDLDALAAQGFVDKVHGGAVAVVGVAGHTSAPQTAPSIRIGLLLPTDQHYNRTILRGVEAAAEKVGAQLSFVTTGWGVPDEPPSGLGDLLACGVDGILVRPSTSAQEVESGRRAWLEELSLPTVLVEDEPSRFEHTAASSVTTDDERGIAMAVGHLHRLGHRRIGLLLTNHPHAPRIEHAWRIGLQMLGADEDVPLIKGSEVKDWPLPSSESLDKLLSRLASEAVTAVICYNDVPARSLAQHVSERGVSVPAALSVVAYEDKIAAHGPVPLTAVALPQAEIGRIAANALLELIYEPSQPARRIRVRPALHQRDSTGPLSTS